MHINSDPSASVRKRHRLYVALPLFCACIAVSFGLGLHETEMTGNAVSRVEVLHEGTIGEIAFTGSANVIATQSGLIALAGTTTVASPASVSIGALGMTFSAWNGAFELTTDDRRATIAALTAPVDIVRGSDVWIVPVGMQLTVASDAPAFAKDMTAWAASHRTSALPEHYLRDHLAEARALLASVDVASEHRPSRILPRFGDAFRFAFARERADAFDRKVAALEAYRAFETGDEHTIRAALTDPLIIRALRDPRERSTVARMAVLARRSGLEALIAPYVADRTALLFHPALHAYGWAVLDADVSLERLLAEQLALTDADRDADALADPAMTIWGDRWNVALKGSDRRDIAEAVLPHLEEGVRSLDAHGYPDRARRIARIAIDSFSSYGDIAVHSAEAFSRLETFIAGESIVIDAIEDMKAAAPAEPVEVAPLSQEEAHALEASLKTVLMEAGCMFTARTSIKAVSANAIEVDNVVIGTMRGDKALKFTYDPVANTVGNIVHDGAAAAYGMTLPNYLQWVKRGE